MYGMNLEQYRHVDCNSTRALKEEEQLLLLAGILGFLPAVEAAGS